jgi:hypothetical protein
MSTCARWLITVAIVSSSVPIVVGQSGAEKRFQEAVMLERAEGNKAAAARLYERIVHDYASEPAVAVRALLQLGALNETLGRDARGSYERIVRDYSGQTAAVAEARSRLAALDTRGPLGRPLWIGVGRRKVHDVHGYNR